MYIGIGRLFAISDELDIARQRKETVRLYHM